MKQPKIMTMAAMHVRRSYSGNECGGGLQKFASEVMSWWTGVDRTLEVRIGFFHHLLLFEFDSPFYSGNIF